MTPESVPGLRITAADLAPIWQAIAECRSGGQIAVVASGPRLPPQSVRPASLAA